MIHLPARVGRRWTEHDADEVGAAAAGLAIGRRDVQVAALLAAWRGRRSVLIERAEDMP